MGSYTDIWEMDALWLMMEFTRLLELDFKGETDESVPYNTSMLEDQIMMRLNEYAVDRY